MAKTKTKTRRKVNLSAPAPDPGVLPEGWVRGKTCLNCRTTYLMTPMPAFQERDAKYGNYNLARQLPDTAKDYPQCGACLGYSWRAEASRYGMDYTRSL